MGHLISNDEAIINVYFFVLLGSVYRDSEENLPKHSGRILRLERGRERSPAQTDQRQRRRRRGNSP